MRLLRPLVAFVALALATPGAALASGHPLDGLEVRYRITARVSYEAGTVRGVLDAVVTNRTDPPRDHLDFSVLARAFGEMTITATKRDGVALRPSYPNRADLRIPLDPPLGPGEKSTIRIEWRSVAKADVADSLRARFSRAGGIMQVSSWHPVLSDGHGLRYPGDSQVSGAADYAVTLKLPSALRFAVPGSVSSTISGGERTIKAKLTAAREFAFAIGPDLVRANATTKRAGANGKPVIVEAHARSSAAAKSAARLGAAALDALAADWGPYPYARFLIAQSTRPASGNEYPGIVFLGRANLASRYVVFHEAAHQWFYGLLGNDQLREPWLDEGLAEWAGRRAAGIAQPADCAAPSVDQPVTAWADAPASGQACGDYNATVYYRTAAMLAALSDEFGPAAIETALRDLIASHRGRIAGEADFVAALAGAVGDPAPVRAFLYPDWLSE